MLLEAMLALAVFGTVAIALVDAINRHSAIRFQTPTTGCKATASPAKHPATIQRRLNKLASDTNINPYAGIFDSMPPTTHSPEKFPIVVMQRNSQTETTPPH